MEKKNENKTQKQIEELVKKDLANIPNISQKWEIKIDLDSISDDEI